MPVSKLTGHVKRWDRTLQLVHVRLTDDSILAVVDHIKTSAYLSRRNGAQSIHLARADEVGYDRESNATAYDSHQHMPQLYIRKSCLLQYPRNY